MSQRTSQMSWSGWGEPNRAQPLSLDLRQLLRDALGVRRDGPSVPRLAELRPPTSQLSSAHLEELATIVGPAHVTAGDEARIRHLRGKSTPDLLALRAGDLAAAPDAVVWPASHAEVLELLGVCASHRIAVVPFGGGTSVVGGLAPARAGHRAVVALDLNRLNRLLSLDEISRLATLEPGLRGPDAEAELAARGYTLGHFPQSFEFASIGGFAATRSSGQASAGYGRFDERVVAIRVATPGGTVTLGQAPKSAAGPDLRELFLGSEGTLGVITSVTVEIAPAPEVRRYEGWRLPDFAAGREVVRRLVQDGPLPSVLRLSDEVETALNLARPDAVGTGQGTGSLLICGWEGAAGTVRTAVQGSDKILRAAGAEPAEEAGPAWAAGRFAAPYLRDALLDAGALVETLETACFWSGLPDLYEAVRQALVQSLGDAGTPPVVLCHISHVYRSGASLYFTVACAQADDPLEQWRRAKAAASDAILAAGGSITHHHGVGTEHRAWYHRQLGELPLAALRAAKRELDPAGILNPGVLV
ncbi:MAG TPA: FAD-binding oxidoreductase [Solirubrobacteraceae bacterium]|nr:FAD-binding oxidoreductase [Solirubrobacteraceae bacterium]